MTHPDLPTGPRVRPATHADLPVLGRLGALLVDTHHAFDARRFIAPTAETPQGYAWFLGTQLDEPGAAVLVADADGAVVGYAYATVEGHDYLSLRGPAGVLHDLVVDPAHRGRGTGALLLQAALAFLRSQGAPRVVLSTAQANEPAQRLFARLGFRRTMVEMTRELDEPGAG